MHNIATDHKGNAMVFVAAMFGTGDALKSQAMQVIYQMTDGTEVVRPVVVPGASILDQMVAS